MFLDTLPPAHRGSFLRDLSSAQTAVRGGHVSSTRTSALYNQWTTFCADLQLDHRLQDDSLPTIEILQVYGHRVRHGYYSRQDSVRSDSVATVWRAIIETHVLEGLQDPRKPRGSTAKELDKRLTRQLRHYSYQDPPSKREKSVPLGLVVKAVESADKTPSPNA